MHIIKILFATLILSTCYSCKKYANGPSISLKSEEARLVRKWQVQVAYHSMFTDMPSQGEDQTYIWQNMELEFKADKSYEIKNYSLDMSEYTVEKGSWEFTEDLSKVKTTGIAKRYDSETANLLSQDSKNSAWRIMRLTKNEFWVWYENQVDPPWIYMKFDVLK
jgi:hypothetical protein